MSNYYYQDKIAPPASSLHIGTAVAIRYGGCILFDHRRDGKWGLIGGALEIGESLEECVRREAQEETRLELTKLELLGTFSHPSRIIERYSEVVQSVTICFSADSDGDQIQLSEESKEAKFYTREEIENLAVVATHSMIIPYPFKPESWPVIE